jgi:hypothetical protein
MAITFHDATHLGLGVFIQVLQDGHLLGRIFQTTGGYRFYPGDELTLGAVDLEDEDLERLKDKILAKYRTARS